MQRWKRTDTQTVKLQLTAAVALALKSVDEKLAILDDPAQILDRLHTPEVLLPVAVAMSDMELAIEDWRELAGELTGARYESLRAAVEKEVIDFFPERVKSILTELIDLNQQTAANSIAKLRAEIDRETAELSAGTRSSSNSPESSASATTGNSAPPANSISCAGDETGSAGTTLPASSPPSSTAVPTAASP